MGRRLKPRVAFLFVFSVVIDPGFTHGDGEEIINPGKRSLRTFPVGATPHGEHRPSHHCRERGLDAEHGGVSPIEDALENLYTAKPRWVNCLERWPPQSSPRCKYTGWSVDRKASNEA